jgi:hypothetical protein
MQQSALSECSQGDTEGNTTLAAELACRSMRLFLGCADVGPWSRKVKRTFVPAISIPELLPARHHSMSWGSSLSLHHSAPAHYHSMAPIAAVS